MTDERLTMIAPDAERIDLHDSQEICEWTCCLGVGEQELREAVDAVGNAPGRVREYLSLA